MMRVIDDWLARRRRIEAMRRQAFRREARMQELAQRIVELHERHMASEAWHVEVREHLEHVVTRLGKRLNHRDELLGQLLIAVGRVQVLEDQPVSSFEGLPRLVSMVVDDHEDLEGRIQAVVEYLRGVDEELLVAGPTETPVRVEDVRETVGKLLQGAEPQIVDLQGGNEMIKEG